MEGKILEPAKTPGASRLDGAVSLFPLVRFDAAPLEEANACLEAWGHKMGPLHRGVQGDRAYILADTGGPVAVAIHSTLIRENVAGRKDLTRDNTVELSRLCAARPGLCRVALRLWREFVFPNLGYPWAISYQDADLHNGHTYRFDGWARIGYSHSGTDQRSGRKGRNKWIWQYPAPKAERSDAPESPRGPNPPVTSDLTQPGEAP